MFFICFFPCSQCVPIVFAKGSPSSQDVPSSTSDLSNMICPKFSCIQTEKVGYRGAHLFLFCNLVVQRGASMGPGQSIIWLLRKKRKSRGHSHELINMNHSHSNYVVIEFNNSSTHDFYQTSQKE